MKGEKNNYRLLQSTLDSMMENIAVIDSCGTIIMTNNSWDNFMVENGGQPDKCGVGVNYLEQCRRFDNENSCDMESIYDNLLWVINGAKPFYILEYPCHSPDKKRWFILHATPLCIDEDIILRGAVVSHINITDYKLIEEKFKESFKINR